jgi:cytolysin (calcineurin-like family phosphatase)
MTTTYRTDYSHDDGQVFVVHFGSNSTKARAYARKASSKHGSAYVIKAVDGQDVAQLPHYDGRACPHGWAA